MKKNQPGFLGLLMLDTNFPRFVGDIGNPASFSFPVEKRIIKGASPEKIIRQSSDEFLAPFLEAARDLERDGARVISTSCGFLTPFQEKLQEAVSVPVLASSLFLHAHLESLTGTKKRVGILTISASSLSPAHLLAAGISEETPIGTTEGGEEFTRAILENRPALDYEKARRDNLAAAMKLSNSHTDLDAILLECTNMPPYAQAIAEATGLAVYSILDGLDALWTGSISDIRQPRAAGSGSRNNASQER